jgi:hypothetical protein
MEAMFLTYIRRFSVSMSKDTKNVIWNIVLNDILLILFISISIMRLFVSLSNSFDKVFYYVSAFLLPPLDIFLQIVINKKFKSKSKIVNAVIFPLPMIISLFIIGYEYIYMMIVYR